MRTVTILQLVNLSTSSLRQQLVTHTYTTYRFVALLHLLAYYLYCILTHVWVARTVSKEQTVKLHIGIVIVPRHTNHFASSVDEATDDVCLHTTIHKHHLLGFLACWHTALSWLISDNFLDWHLIHEVHSFVVCLRNIVWFVIKEYLAHHHTMLSQHLCQSAGVDARDGRDFFSL